MAILTVKFPCTIAIVTRGAPLIFLVVAEHGQCCKIFGILNNRLISEPFADLLGELPLEPVPLDLQYLLIWPFLKQS